MLKNFIRGFGHQAKFSVYLAKNLICSIPRISYFLEKTCQQMTTV